MNESLHAYVQVRSLQFIPSKDEGKQLNTSEVIEVSIFVCKIPVFHNFNFKNVITRKKKTDIKIFGGTSSSVPFHSTLYDPVILFIFCPITGFSTYTFFHHVNRYLDLNTLYRDKYYTGLYLLLILPGTMHILPKLKISSNQNYKSLRLVLHIVLAVYIWLLKYR